MLLMILAMNVIKLVWIVRKMLQIVQHVQMDMNIHLIVKTNLVYVKKMVNPVPSLAMDGYGLVLQSL